MDLNDLGTPLQANLTSANTQIDSQNDHSILWNHCSLFKRPKETGTSETPQKQGAHFLSQSLASPGTSSSITQTALTIQKEGPIAINKTQNNC